MKSISEAAIRRAKAADPNGARCLIENCPQERAVEVAHIFARENSANRTMMRSIEWSWNMRQHTLNLDTRRNVFLLGASMHSLYKDGKWALLPTEEIVDRYFGKPRGRYNRAFALDREVFPELSGPTFQYSFLPLCDMSSFGITRQNEACDPPTSSAFQTHVHPFDTLPMLNSHVHPTFVLLHLSQLLFDRGNEPYIKALLRTRPLVAKIAQLSVKWASPRVPKRAESDPTFVTAPVTKERQGVPSPDLLETGSYKTQSEFDCPSSDGHSIDTVPHRLPCTPLITYSISRPAKHSSDDMSRDGLPDERDSKRKRISHSAEPENPENIAGEQMHERAASDGWTRAEISSWARECSPQDPVVVDEL